MFLTFKEKMDLVEKYTDDIADSLLDGIRDADPPVEPSVLFLEAIDHVEKLVIERMQLRNNN